MKLVYDTTGNGGHMFRKIYDYCRYNIPRGIKNLIIWFPTVWQDRQWDHYFIYKMLRQKLHFTEQMIRNHGIHVNNIEDADRIKKCVDLLDRLMDDVYHDEAFSEFYQIYGHPKLRWDDIKDSKDLVELHVEYQNSKGKSVAERDAAFRHASETEIMLREYDIKRLFEIMTKHIQEWWD